MLLAAAGCGESPTGPSGGVEEITRLPRALSAAEAEIIGAGNQFAFGLLAQANSPNANLFLSPLSASMALGMTMNGAAGETWSQMREVLGFGSLAEEEINAAYASLLELLVGLDPAVGTAAGNSVWTRRGFPVHADFLEAVRETFGAEVAELDFASPAAAERDQRVGQGRHQRPHRGHRALRDSRRRPHVPDQRGLLQGPVDVPVRSVRNATRALPPRRRVGADGVAHEPAERPPLS